jgi:hypothetical protein
MATKITVSSVASSASSVTLLAANPNRNGLVISNNSTAILYVLLGGGTATATTANSFQLATLEHIAVPDFHGSTFKGAITGIWAAANGSAQITEME